MATGTCATWQTSCYADKRDVNIELGITNEMPQSSQIIPATLSGASIVIQVCLLTIAYIAIEILSRSFRGRFSLARTHSTLVFWLLLTILMIVMSEDLYAQWSPILGDVSLPTIPTSGAFLAVFVLDLVFVSTLIYRTGGSKSSPFTSLLFLLPTLAIFLREPAPRFLAYSVAVGAIYVLMLKFGSFASTFIPEGNDYQTTAQTDEQAHDWATAWTNISCLVLATLIGYITRPQ